MKERGTERERERDRESVRVRAHVYERVRQRVYRMRACVCVSERAGEKEWYAEGRISCLNCAIHGAARGILHVRATT